MICCQFVCGVVSDELVAVKLCVIKLINDTILKYIIRLTEAFSRLVSIVISYGSCY